MTNINLPILVLDFDGVVHSYEKGWQEGRIYGTVVPGFFEWAEQAMHYFRLAIFSSRSDSHKNIQPMKDWLQVHLQSWLWDHPDSTLHFNMFEFPTVKPPAFVTIDDRALLFRGQWGEPQFEPKRLQEFRSWVSPEPKENTDERGK